MTDAAYQQAGAKILSADDIYKDADVILRVRHPAAAEIRNMGFKESGGELGDLTNMDKLKASFASSNSGAESAPPPPPPPPGMTPPPPPPPPPPPG